MTQRGAKMALIAAAALRTAALGLTGCVTQEPLQEIHLKQEAQDPRVSIVVLHFKTHGLLATGGIFPDMPEYRSWVFAVANESTGWNFRRLDRYSMIFRTRDDVLDLDDADVDAGWVTFLAPPGTSYIAVTWLGVVFHNFASGLVPVPSPDRISVGYSEERAKQAGFEEGWEMIDYIDVPRVAVQVPGTRSLIYAGTIVRTP